MIWRAKPPSAPLQFYRKLHFFYYRATSQIVLHISTTCIVTPKYRLIENMDIMLYFSFLHSAWEGSHPPPIPLLGPPRRFISVQHSPLPPIFPPQNLINLALALRRRFTRFLSLNLMATNIDTKNDTTTFALVYLAFLYYVHYWLFFVHCNKYGCELQHFV